MCFSKTLPNNKKLQGEEPKMKPFKVVADAKMDAK
jgi:hypothetical protein